MLELPFSFLNGRKNKYHVKKQNKNMKECQLRKTGVKSLTEYVVS